MVRCLRFAVSIYRRIIENDDFNRPYFYSNQSTRVGVTKMLKMHLNSFFNLVSLLQTTLQYETRKPHNVTVTPECCTSM